MTCQNEFTGAEGKTSAFRLSTQNLALRTLLNTQQHTGDRIPQAFDVVVFALVLRE
jgi:hypothetical protein